MQDDKPLAMAPAQVALHNLGDLLKSNLAAFVAAAIVVVVLAILYFTTESLQPPQAKLNSQIEVEVEKAKRMLANYNPVGERVTTLIDTAFASSTQPMTEPVPEDQWPVSLKTLREHLDSVAGQIEPLNVRYRAWSGETPAPGTAAGYSQLKEQLEKNLAQVSEALKIVQSAVNMSVEAGDRTISGRDHPVATRLEAVLIYHQADLLRQKAAARRDHAVTARAEFERARAQWQMLQSQIAAIQAVAHREAASVPAAARAPAVPQSEPPKAATRPPEKTVPAGKPGVVSRLTGLLFGKKKPDVVPPDSTSPEPAPAQADRETKEPVVESPEPPAPTAVVKPPTPQQRLSELATQREQAIIQIAAAEADVARLRDHVSDLEHALAGAKQAARDAQLRMMRLEEQGVDPTDPEAIERFKSDYQQASTEYRKQVREAALLENGGIRNARPDTQDEREYLNAPLVSADPAQPMNPTEGLVSVRKRLQAAEEQHEAAKNLLATIDVQVAAVQRRQSDDSARLTALEQRQAALKEQAAKAIKDAVVATAEADKLARDAIELLSGDGRQAAQNARTAADNQIREARNRQQPGVENPRLEIITKSGMLVGSAQTLEADIALLTAYVQAARVSDLLAHAQVLSHAESMGVRPQQPQDDAALAYEAAAAAEEARKAREQAIAVAREAYNSYREASAALDNLWVLNANAAAVCYLLSSLQTGEEADKSRDLAIRIYEQTLQGRSDRKDIADYRRALDGLNRLRQARAR